MKKQQVVITQHQLVVTYATIGKTFKADLDKYSAEIRESAMLHGFKQKFGDAASGGTPAEKYEMVQRIHAGLLAGDWELTGERDNSGIIIEAVCRIKKLDEKKVRAATEKDEEKLKEWASNPTVKAEIAKIRAERAAKLAEGVEAPEIKV